MSATFSDRAALPGGSVTVGGEGPFRVHRQHELPVISPCCSPRSRLWLTDPQPGTTAAPDPEITYYRRVRGCSSCGHVYFTGEISHDRLSELVRLRATMQKLSDEAKRLSSTTNKLRKLLKD